jgi:hypothetical protein
MMFSFPFLDDFEVRTRLALPALGMLDQGDGAPDAVVKESDLGRLCCVRCDARDHRVEVDVVAAAVQRPQHPMSA